MALLRGLLARRRPAAAACSVPCPASRLPRAARRPSAPAPEAAAAARPPPAPRPAPQQASLRDNSAAGMHRVLVSGLAFCAVLYSTVAIGGYTLFGSRCGRAFDGRSRGLEGEHVAGVGRCTLFGSRCGRGRRGSRPAGGSSGAAPRAPPQLPPVVRRAPPGRSGCRSARACVNPHSNPPTHPPTHPPAHPPNPAPPRLPSRPHTAAPRGTC